MTPSKTNSAIGFLASHFKGASGFFNLCFKSPKGLQTQTYSLGAYRVFEAAAVKAENEAQKADVYFEVCPQANKPARGGRGLADTACSLMALWVDIDIQGESHKAELLPTSEGEALALLEAFPLLPSCTVRTGGGLHGYWLLQDPLLLATSDDRARARELTDSLQAFFRRSEVNPKGWKVDSTSDLARLLRLPGTFNRKTSPAKVVETILFQPERRYHISELQARLKPARGFAPEPTQRPEGASRVQMWIDAVPGATQGGRNAEANRVAFKLIDGWGPEASFETLQTWNDRCSPPLDTKELRTCYNSALKGVERKGGPSLACATAEPRGFGLVGDPGPDPWSTGLLEDADDETEAEAVEEEPKQAAWPAPMEPEALHGILGEITRTVEPHTESDPAAILVQALVMAGHLIGRGPFFPVERTKHGCNENVVIVGNSSKARKGTSWSNVREIGKAALGAGPKGLQIINGLGSGEALVSAVQDRPEDEGASSGEVSDRKRLLIMEQEYAHVLKVGAREGSTLSPTLRAAWDGEPISNLTKGSRLTSTGHHLSFIGHITGRELRETLPAVEAANGNANRNIFIAAKRSKYLPEGGALTDEDVKVLGDKLRQRLEWVKSIGKAPVVRDPAARWLWAQIYRSLSEGLPGLAGSILGRAEAHVTRISLLYALLDSSSVIRLEHLLAALAVWDYSVASVLYVFGSKLEVGLSDSILTQLRATPSGMTRTELSKFLQGNKTSVEIGRALSFLEDQGLAEKVKEKSPNPLCKKPVERWKARKEQACDTGTGYLRQAKVALQSLPTELRIYVFNELKEVTNLIEERLF